MTREEYEKLTEEERQIKVAELDKWTDICQHEVNGRAVYYGWHPEKHPKSKHRYETPLPDYLNDLNAMHEAEKKMYAIERGRYEIRLGSIRLKDSKSYCSWDAPAAQRAEAFVLTMSESI